MRPISSYPLWLGHAGDGRDFSAILDAGIQAIVQLAVDEPALQPPRELIYCRFPLVDGPGNDPNLLRLAIATVANLFERGIKTLVCCGGGMSRSPVIAAAALATVLQETPEDCLKTVADHAPSDVTPGLWEEVRALLETKEL